MASDPVKKIGKYDVVEVLGQGGMGAVYKAVDPLIGRSVAIKVIKGDFAENPELLKRFYREAQAVGNLQHPNIVIVFDLGEENGNPYLVMEYLDGTPLDKLIAVRHDLPMIQKLEIVIGVLNALHYAHKRNIVHRDVKPANVQLLADGTRQTTRLRHCPRGQPGADQDRAGHGHHDLHVAGTAQRRSCRRTQRRFFRWHHAVRVAYVQLAFRGRRPHVTDRETPAGRSSSAAVQVL